MEPGGSERQLLYLLRGLDRSRFEPVLYLLYDTGALLADLPSDVPKFSFWGETEQPFFSWPGRIHGMQIRHLEKTLRQERIDVTYDRLFHMALIAGPATRRAGVPRVSTIVSPPQFDVGRKDNRWRWIKRRRLSRAYRESAALLTVAPGTADNASLYYAIPRERFEVVRSPIDLHRIEELAQSPEPLECFREGRAHVMAAGRLSQEKGHRYLIEAAAMYLQRYVPQGLPAIDLHLAGDGPLKSELASHAKRLGIENQVHLYGHVQNPYAMMRRSDLFCMPSLYEGMPNAMLEAMACEVPVLATNTQQGPGELLRERPLGTLVPTADASALCDAMADRFRNPEAWRNRARMARQYVAEHHDMGRWLARMSQIFESVCLRNPS